MVLSSAGKAARHQASIMNRPTCGGVKKAGLAPSVGWNLSNSAGPARIRTLNRMPLICDVSRVVQTQRIGYRATRGI